jgi:hypothetical protein
MVSTGYVAGNGKIGDTFIVHKKFRWASLPLVGGVRSLVLQYEIFFYSQLAECGHEILIGPRRYVGH